jgi:glutamate racemase
MYHNTRIIEQVGHGLVELIENGKLNSPEMKMLLHSYVDPMIKENIDYLVLGCSHYPYLIPQLKKILPKNIQIIDSGEAVARQTQHILKEKVGMHIEGKGKAIFYSNGNPAVLEAILEHKFKVTFQDF